MTDAKLRKDLIWNTAGSAMYACASFVLAFAAMRYAGSDDGGVFSFGYATLGQQFFILAYFGLRPFHITDTRREYSYGAYRSLRRVTAVAAFIGVIILMMLMPAAAGYTFRKSTILILVVMMKIMDGVADLYESECQRIGKLYIAGMELSLRTLMVCTVMIGTLILCYDILASVTAALITETVYIVVFKLIFERNIGVPGDGAHPLTGCPETGVSSPGSARDLFRDTYLIFLCAFIDFYIFSSSKYAVDLCMTNADDGIFNILFAPTSVIYLGASFILRPYLSRLSGLLDDHDRAGFMRVLKGLFIFIGVLGAAGTILAVLIGRPVLGIAELILGPGYTGALSIYHTAFICIIMGGVLYALSSLCYYVLIIVRRQRLMTAGYIVAAVICSAISYPAARFGGIPGAGAGYALSMAVMLTIFLAMMFSALRERG